MVIQVVDESKVIYQEHVPQHVYYQYVYAPYEAGAPKEQDHAYTVSGLNTCTKSLKINIKYNSLNGS